MRLPLVPQLGTKDGVSDSNARMTNVLAEADESGQLACVRPGLQRLAEDVGNGKGVVSFNDELISVYGSTLKFASTPVEVPTTQVDIGEVRDWYAATYGNGKYVLAAHNSNRFATSTDGITWTLGALPQSAEWLYAAYNGATYVIVSPSSNKVAYSNDAVSWTVVTLGPEGVDNLLSSVSSGLAVKGSTFCLLMNNSVYTSTDGSTWTLTDTTYTSNEVITADDTYFYMGVGLFNGYVGKSVDGISWTYENLPDDGYPGSVAFTGAAVKDGVVILKGTIPGGGEGGGTLEVVYANNGGVWTYVNSPIQWGYGQIVIACGYFVLIGWSGNGTHDFAYSLDGVTWQTTDVEAGAYVYSVATDGTSVFIPTGSRYAAFVPNIERPSNNTLTAVTGDFFDFAQSVL